MERIESARTSQTPEQGESSVQKLVEAWKKGPVIIASSSAYKIENLKQIGIEHVEARSAPEEVETELFSRFENNKGFIDESISRLLAQAKVRYVVEQGVPDNALVCGFDTIAIQTETGEDRRERSYLQKPETREEAHANLTSLFAHLARERKEFEELFGDMQERLNDRRRSRGEAAVYNLEIGTPEALILITTGMAVRLPGNGNIIYASIATARMKPLAVYALAHLEEAELTKRCAALAEEALMIMDPGERWKHITTGIDYADPRIISLLKLEEAKIFSDMPDAEEGVFKGMPQQAFAGYLALLAKLKLENNFGTRK